MTPDDLAWYLCMHGCRHAWFRLKWTGDLARLHAEGKIDWARGLENARAAGLQKSVLATQALLRELYDLSITKNERENASSRAESRLLALMRGAIAAPETHGTPSELFRPHFYEWTAGPRKTLWAFFKQKLYRREDYLLLPLSNRFFWLYVPLRLLSFFWRHWRHA
jgi:post-segregation antitoxin (ccd killing protein)